MTPIEAQNRAIQKRVDLLYLVVSPWRSTDGNREAEIGTPWRATDKPPHATGRFATEWRFRIVQAQRANPSTDTRMRPKGDR